MERETLGSRLGFILLSAGCAIGIGNVWKFPYLTGENGGGAFVLFYLFFLAVLGLPVMTMEFAMGRASKKSPLHMYRALAADKKGWHWHGPVCLVGNVILMMFYTSVAGWMLQYFVMMAAGRFQGADPDKVNLIYQEMLASPAEQLIAMGVIVALGFYVCSRGLQNGLERVTKVMMILLLIIMVILAVNSIFLKGGSEGIRFYLQPNLKNMKEAGIGNVIVNAMNQAFFTLSLGVGSMAIFGSYIDKERTLLGEAVNVALLDTFVAITSGLIIFPACFAYKVEPGYGPGLIFATLPNIFNHMKFGRLWGSLFFVFMSFAAFSTVLAVFENIMACVMDLTGWKRGKTGLICGICMFFLSIPCLLGFNVLSGIHPLGPKTGIMDLEDFIVSNILLPGGSLIFVLFCTSRYGWGWKKFKEEANTGKGLKIADWMRFYMTWILPVIVIAVFLVGILPYISKLFGR